MKTKEATCLARCGSLSAVDPRPTLVPEEIVQDRKLHSNCRSRQVANSETGLEEREAGELYDDADTSDGVEPETMLHKGSAR